MNLKDKLKYKKMFFICRWKCKYRKENEENHEYCGKCMDNSEFKRKS